MDCTPLTNDPARYVGDPIHVVTGANASRNEDFRLVGPVPLVWVRYYDSARNRFGAALGWGHTHEHDCRLEFDLDGLRYVGPVGRAVGFAPLTRDGQRLAREGLRLERVTARFYRVYQVGNPVKEFELPASGGRAPLRRLYQGDREIRFSYGSGGQLEAITDSLGRAIHVESDGQGRVLRLVMPAAGRPRELLRCAYDLAGNLLEARDPYGNALRFTWDENNRLVSKTDRVGYTFRFEYDAEGRCVYSSGQDGQFEVRLRYMSAERVTVVTRGDGGQWTYFYNEEGIITRIIDPCGGSREFQLDEKGQTVAEVDPKGNMTKTLYREDGSAYGKVSPLGQFLPEPELPERRDPRAHRVAQAPLEWECGTLFDGREIRLPAWDDAVLYAVPVVAHTLIRARQAAAAAEPGAAGAPREHDDFGLLLRERVPGGRPRSWSYDANGKVRRYHDADGSTYAYEYSSWNLVARETGPDGATVCYAYTPSRDVASIRDAGGAVSEYDYDLKDRLVRVRRHGVVREEYVYDQADNLVEKRDGQGRTFMRFEVGPGNLHTVRRMAGGANHYLDYDDGGRLLRAATDELEATFAYEGGQRCNDERDGRGVQHRFEWTPPGKLGVAETTVLGKFTIRYEYPDAQTVVIHDPGGQSHKIRVLDGGLVVRDLANRSTEVAMFDAGGRCLFKVRTAQHGREHVWSQAYHYSAEGDLLRAEDSVRGTTQYSYDVAHRLTGEVLPGGEKRQYAYQAGNLVRKPGLTDVVLAEGNRLHSANGSTFEYDHRNHLAARRDPGKTTLYHYDEADMLVRIEDGETVWRAAYDPLGRRVSKSWRGRRVEYYWDSDRLAAEVDEQGQVRVYVYAAPLALVPCLFLDYESLDAPPESGKRYYVHGNQIGAPTLVEDDRRQVVWSARIDPYGRADVDPRSKIELNLRFPGHYFDPETGLHYNRFRHYSPELGRYLESDPAGTAGAINLYAYAANPLTLVDVRGLAPCPTRQYDPNDDEDRRFGEKVTTPGFNENAGRMTRPKGAWRPASPDPPLPDGTPSPYKASHPHKHVDVHDAASRERVTDILNNWERAFTGTNSNGRPVDIYYKDGAYVVTPRGRKGEVITVVGKGFYDEGATPRYQKDSRGKRVKDPTRPGTPSEPVDPSRWGDDTNWQERTDAPGQREEYEEITR